VCAAKAREIPTQSCMAAVRLRAVRRNSAHAIFIDAMLMALELDSDLELEGAGTS